MRKISRQVTVFTYTEHFMEGKITEKIGTNCLLRRSLQGDEIMLFLIKHGDITKLTADTLSKLLQARGLSVRKNLSKPNKVRQILKLDEIKSNVSQARIDKVLQELEELEKRQKKGRT